MDVHGSTSAIYSLSVHAGYRCRHSGACCTSGWPIPIERATAERLRTSITSGALEVPGTPIPLVPLPDAPAETPVVAAVKDGKCVFYDRDSRLCGIHRQLGPELLPVACRQFPRVSLADGRGVFVTLSHYCPTAASLLFDYDGPLEIVQSPAAFAPDFPFDPLDAREALPPLLRPGVLLDLAAFDRWEREVVGILARDDLNARSALRLIAAFTETVRAWPRKDDLANHLDRAAGQRTGRGDTCVAPTGVVPPGLSDDTIHHYNLVLAAIPGPFRPVVCLDGLAEAYRERVEPRWDAFARVVKRYLASKVFGSWLAYEGEGLRTIVFSARVALSLVKIEASVECARQRSPLDRGSLAAAIRRADELLVHLASREELARRLGAVEKVDGTRSPDVG